MMSSDCSKKLNETNTQGLFIPSLAKGNHYREDGNSSTETLSAEERHTINHMQRQEPQGEEHVKIFSSPSLNSSSLSFNPSSCHNNDSNSSMSSNSNTNTLIIHHSVPQESWSNQWLSGYSTKLTTRESSAPPSTNIDPSSYSSYLHNTLLSENLLASCSPQGVTSTLLNSSIDSSSPYLGAGNSSYLGKNCSLYVNGNATPKYSSNSTEIPDIPSSYLDQSEVLKHLINKNVKESGHAASGGMLATSGIHGIGSTTASGAFSDQSASSSSSAINFSQVDRGSVSGSSSHGSQYISGLLDRDDTTAADLSTLLYRLDHPPPAYPAWQGEGTSAVKSSTDSRVEKNALLSKSQPDLTRIGLMKDYSPNTAKDLINSRFAMACIENEENPVFLKELVDILTRENSAIKVELDMCRRKVAKLQKFEMEMTIVEEQYEALVKGCERREQLEKLARHKLQAELRKLTDQNNELKDRLEASKVPGTLDASPSVCSDATGLDSLSMKKELNKRDVVIAQLISQNKELAATKERQSMELTAQRQTLNEQRTHIDILDSALRNAQANILKLEEEVRKKQNAVEQAGQMKRLLLSIKIASDRREQSEKNLRQKLEMEILQLKSNAEMEKSCGDMADLRREIRQKDEKILALESESAKLEQRFMQETAWRQTSVDAISSIKDTKESVALGKNAVTGNQVVSLDLNDEIRNLKSKIAMLETRNRNLESYSAESETVIRGLQKQIKESESCRPEQDYRSIMAARKDVSIPSSCPVTASAVSLSHARYDSVGEQGASQQQPPLSSFIPRKDEELGEILL